MNIAPQFIITILALVTSILLHECGHYLMAKKKGYKAHIRLEKSKGKIPDIVTSWYGKPHTDRETNQIILAGVLLGTVPLVVLTTGLNYISALLVLWAWFGYFWLSKDDLKKVKLYSDEVV